MGLGGVQRKLAEELYRPLRPDENVEMTLASQVFVKSSDTQIRLLSTLLLLRTLTQGAALLFLTPPFYTFFLHSFLHPSLTPPLFTLPFTRAPSYTPFLSLLTLLFFSLSYNLTFSLLFFLANEIDFF